MANEEVRINLTSSADTSGVERAEVRFVEVFDPLFECVDTLAGKLEGCLLYTHNPTDNNPFI